MVLRSVASLSPDDPEPRDGGPDPERGRRIVLGIVIAILIWNVTIITLFLLLRGTDRLGTQLGRFGGELVLGMKLYQGRTWARWLIALGLVAAAVLSINHLVTHRFEPLMLGMLVVHGGSALLLVFHPAVRAHFEANRPS